MSETKRRKAFFFIDGFNLYHSILAAEKLMPEEQLKWLDIPSFCRSYLPLLGKDVDLGEVHYFSAYADHLQQEAPDKPERHRKFVRALTASKVIAHIGRFYPKQVWSHQLTMWLDAYEEKETDVAIACKVLSLAQRNAFDVAVLVTGDSDFSPLARTFIQDFPHKKIRFAFPFARISKELKQICLDSFTISKEAYQKYQFPDKVRLPSKKFVTIPQEWKPNSG
ncbi:MAG: NYN domain-containing protein [Puniceicoccaceae bacterium]|nr:MAG: NYN domain-containing protein [Puniceicoccaceae bacterium]